MEFHSPSQKPFKAEFIRKSFHLSSFAYVLLFNQSPYLAFSIAGAGVALYLLFFGLGYSQKIPFLNKVYHICLRDDSFDKAPLYLAFGMIAASLIDPKPNHLYYAAFVISVSDTAACLIGRYYGKKHIPFLNKTWEGTLSFFILTFLAALLLLPSQEALIYAGILSLVELFSLYGLDNLNLPAASAYLLKYFLG